MSKIIVIEGPDRVGKQTQTRMLREALSKRGIFSTIVEVPIHSPITYRIIYWMLRNGLAKKLPKTFQWFQYLNRKIFQVFRLPRLEDRYDVIIMDRWSLSTIVYGAAEGVPESFTLALAEKLRKPDFTIVLSGRSFAHEAEDHYESDSDLQMKVRVEYSAWANANKDTSVLLDCAQQKDVISKKILSVLKERGIVPRY